MLRDLRAALEAHSGAAGSAPPPSGQDDNY